MTTARMAARPRTIKHRRTAPLEARRAEVGAGLTGVRLTVMPLLKSAVFVTLSHYVADDDSGASRRGKRKRAVGNRSGSKRTKRSNDSESENSES